MSDTPETDAVSSSGTVGQIMMREHAEGLERQRDALRAELAGAKAVLRKACDRDWKDESLYATASIAANGMHWRGKAIDELHAALSRQREKYDDLQAHYSNELTKLEGRQREIEEGRDALRTELKAATLAANDERTNNTMTLPEVIAALRDELAEAQARGDRLFKDRYDLLNVKTTDGLTASEWVMRTATAEGKADEARRKTQEGGHTFALAAFGAAVLDESRDSLVDLDGGWIQDKAELLGLLERVTVTEPCGEGCKCAEYGEFPQECLRLTKRTPADQTEGAKP